MKPIVMHDLATQISKHDVLNYLREQGYEVINRIAFYEKWEWDSHFGRNKVQLVYTLEHAVGFYDQEDHRFRRAFCISDQGKYKPDAWNFHIYDVYTNNCVELSLITVRGHNGRNYGTDSSIADGIYYGIKGLDCFYKDGRLKRGFGGHLNRRLSGFSSNSRTTAIMLSIAVNSLDMTDDRDNPTQAICNKFGIQDRGLFSHCHFNKHIVTLKPKLKRVCLSGKVVYILKSEDPEAHGYEVDTARDSYSSSTYYYKLPNEIYVDEEYVDRNSVVMKECDHCNREHIDEYMIVHKGETLCLNCAPYNYAIQNYSCQVEDLLQFKATKVKANPLYFGIELEYESAHKMRKTRIYTGNKLKDHALMKHDGSLRDGVEVVSCPAEFDIHKPLYKSFLDDLPDNITVSNRTGMHVHVSRNALSPLQEGRIIDFMNRSDNQNFIRKIAMRESNNYQRPYDHSLRTALRVRKKIKDGEGLYSYPKYSNLNLSKRYTIEFRVFSTPRTYKEFMIKMEFVKALVDYCQLAWYNVGLKSQSYYENFTNWLSEQRKSYSNLYNFCKEKSLCA